MDTRKKDVIRIVGAREHNLKNISLELPKNALTVITGPSGSGKSTLALDILFNEGQRRYVESLSTYARQFLGMSKKPDVDRIDGLCPAIAIEQKTVGANPRSTVGTITEIHDYLRVLFARVGHAHCPTCFSEIKPESVQTIVAMVNDHFMSNTIAISCPLAHERKGEFVADIKKMFDAGWSRFSIDGMQIRVKSHADIEELHLKKTHKHTIDCIIDVLEVSRHEHVRLTEAVETAFRLSPGLCKITVGAQENIYSSSRMCMACAKSIPELEPRLFSFNSPIGACAKCNGLGIIHEWPWKENDDQAWKSEYPEFFSKYATIQTCASCAGCRLNPLALSVTVGTKNIYEIGNLSVKDALKFFEDISLAESEEIIAKSLLREIIQRLTFLDDVGLSYLSLNRSARTLSGGEGQRIRLATQIGSALSGVLYVLDEPSIGLHQRDNERLIATLKKLKDLGNTVVVVEHDMETIAAADHIIDMGPAAGIHGGYNTASGTPEHCSCNNKSLTGQYLAGHRAIKLRETTRKPRGWLTLAHANKNNLKNLTVKFPMGLVCGVSGVSGSGKSTLIMQELVPSLNRTLGGARMPTPGDPDLQGAEQLEHVVVIDQSPIGRTPRSNSATYLGIFDGIRSLFALLPESSARGYSAGRFSFNVQEGRCSECRGDGVIKVSMHFLPDVTMTCKSCGGTRYSKETLEVKFRDKNIADILEMTALEARDFFVNHTQLYKRLSLMCEVGLDYIKLGQSATTLSGGEAQRVKLVDELAKRGNKTLYILDEPTTGLHNSDIEKLLDVLNNLVDKGNSMIIIEHNLDVLKTVDYLIDLGPEGGTGGGSIVAEGKPCDVARCKQSHTGRYLKNLFS